MTNTVWSVTSSEWSGAAAKACRQQAKSGSGKTETAFQPAQSHQPHTPSCHDLIMASIPLPIQEQRPSASHWNGTRCKLKRNGMDPMIKPWDDGYGVISDRRRRLASAHERAAYEFYPQHIHSLSTALSQAVNRLGHRVFRKVSTRPASQPPDFSRRPFSRAQSRAFSVSRLSCSFLPRARASSSLARPCSLK